MSFLISRSVECHITAKSLAKDTILWCWAYHTPQCNKWIWSTGEKIHGRVKREACGDKSVPVPLWTRTEICTLQWQTSTQLPWIWSGIIKLYYVFQSWFCALSNNSIFRNTIFPLQSHWRGHSCVDLYTSNYLRLNINTFKMICSFLYHTKYNCVMVAFA
jgi:hypothetical protein